MGSCGVQISSCGSSFHRTEDWSSSSKSSSSCSLESSRNTWKEKNRERKGCLLPLWLRVCAFLGGFPIPRETYLLQSGLWEAVLLQVKVLLHCRETCTMRLSKSLFRKSYHTMTLKFMQTDLTFGKKKRGETIFVYRTWGVAYLPWSTVRGWTRSTIILELGQMNFMGKQWKRLQSIHARENEGWFPRCWEHILHSLFASFLPSDLGSDWWSFFSWNLAVEY